MSQNRNPKRIMRRKQLRGWRIEPQRNALGRHFQGSELGVNQGALFPSPHLNLTFRAQVSSYSSRTSRNLPISSCGAPPFPLCASMYWDCFTSIPTVDTGLGTRADNLSPYLKVFGPNSGKLLDTIP